MKICIDKSELVQILDIAIKAVSSKSTLPILEGFLIEAYSDTLSVIGNNLEIGIQAEAKCEVLKPGKIVVNAKLISDIVKKSPDGEIDLTAIDNKLIYEVGNSKSELKTIPANGFPSLELAKGGQVFEIDQQVFKDMINQTIFAAAVDDLNDILSGALLEVNNGQMIMTTCDKYRIAVRKIQYADINFKAVIPGKTLSEISKILKAGKMKIYKNGNLVMFECENFFITGRTMDGDYMDLKRFISDDYHVTVKLNTKDLKAILETVSVFINPEEKKIPIKFDIGVDKFKTSCNSSLGSTENTLNAKIDGEKLKISFNPNHLLDAIKTITDQEIIMKFIGASGPVIISPADGSDRFFYMCLPLMARDNQ